MSLKGFDIATLTFSVLCINCEFSWVSYKASINSFLTRWCRSRNSSTIAEKLSINSHIIILNTCPNYLMLVNIDKAKSMSLYYNSNISEWNHCLWDKTDLFLGIDVIILFGIYFCSIFFWFIYSNAYGQQEVLNISLFSDVWLKESNKIIC